MCDQLNASVLSCYGGPVPTPNIDRLARSGVKFTNATCTTPFCSPSRASIVTGLYPHKHGIVYNVNQLEHPSGCSPWTEQGLTVKDGTTERLLNDAGYATHHYGKWHLSEVSLPYYRDGYQAHINYATEMVEKFWKVRLRDRKTWMDWYGWALPMDISPVFKAAIKSVPASWRRVRFATFIMRAGHLEFPVQETFDYRVADHAIERIKSIGSTPFMITCSMMDPHDPNAPPSPYYERFEPNSIKLPANLEYRAARFEDEWSRRIVDGVGVTGLRELLRIYYAATCMIDDQVGRVLKALDESGHSKDTIVVFCTDHGDMAGGHGMFWKSNSFFYEELVRVPFIISYPGRIKPQENSMECSLVDVMPTLLYLVGHPIPNYVQGRSLAAYLLGDKDPSTAPPFSFCERVQANREHTRLVAPGTPSSFMVRGQGWKYIQY
ncbi:MAG: sulfatase family protein, partial [Ktedonobacteraceae bacterium]